MLWSLYFQLEHDQTFQATCAQEKLEKQHPYHNPSKLPVNATESEINTVQSCDGVFHLHFYGGTL